MVRRGMTNGHTIVLLSSCTMTASKKQEKVPVATSATAAVHMSGKTEARLLGSAVAGISELALFHPVDTIAKRLMTNEAPIFGNGLSATASNLNLAIFRGAASKSAPSKIMSLFPGFGFGAVYKILQRVYKFGGQPVVRDYLKKTHGSEFDAYFGPELGKTMVSATAGSIIGVGEVVLLPLDALKVKICKLSLSLHSFHLCF